MHTLLGNASDWLPLDFSAVTWKQWEAKAWTGVLIFQLPRNPIIQAVQKNYEYYQFWMLKLICKNSVRRECWNDNLKWDCKARCTNMAERFLKFIIMIIAVCFKTVEENSFYLYLRCKKVKPHEAATIKGGRAWKKSCLPSTRENGNLLTLNGLVDTPNWCDSILLLCNWKFECADFLTPCTANPEACGAWAEPRLSIPMLYKAPYKALGFTPFIYTFNSQSRVKPKPGGMNSTWYFTRLGRTQVLEPSSLTFHVH